jgi:hypothetical protein
MSERRHISFKRGRRKRARPPEETQMGRARPLAASRHLDPARPILLVAVAVFCSAFWVLVGEVAVRALHIR